MRGYLAPFVRLVGAALLFAVAMVSAQQNNPVVEAKEPGFGGGMYVTADIRGGQLELAVFNTSKQNGVSGSIYDKKQFFAKFSLQYTKGAHRGLVPFKAGLIDNPAAKLWVTEFKYNDERTTVQGFVVPITLKRVAGKPALLSVMASGGRQARLSVEADSMGQNGGMVLLMLTGSGPSSAKAQASDPLYISFSKPPTKKAAMTLVGTYINGSKLWSFAGPKFTSGAMPLAKTVNPSWMMQNGGGFVLLR